MIWVRKLKRAHTPLEERPCLPQHVSFYLMTCNGWSQGWNLSTTNVLFLIRPARGAGAQLHHSTWERGTGSSGVQRPAWSTSSHPARAAEDPVSEGLELLKRAPPTAAARRLPPAPPTLHRVASRRKHSGTPL